MYFTAVVLVNNKCLVIVVFEGCLHVVIIHVHAYSATKCILYNVACSKQTPLFKIVTFSHLSNFSE